MDNPRSHVMPKYARVFVSYQEGCINVTVILMIMRKEQGYEDKQETAFAVVNTNAV